MYPADVLLEPLSIMLFDSDKSVKIGRSDEEIGYKPV